MRLPASPPSTTTVSSTTGRESMECWPPPTWSPWSTGHYCRSKLCEGRGRVAAEHTLHEVKHTPAHTCAHTHTHKHTLRKHGLRTFILEKPPRELEAQGRPPTLASAPLAVASLGSPGLTRPLGTCPSPTGAHASPLPPVLPQAPRAPPCARPVLGLQSRPQGANMRTDSPRVWWGALGFKSC